MRVRVYRNHNLGPKGRRVEAAILPIGQTLVWLGPVFVLIQSRRFQSFALRRGWTVPPLPKWYAGLRPQPHRRLAQTGKEAPVSRIGTKRDALRALNGELQFLGHGTNRSAYLSDDQKVVYKVERDDGQVANSNTKEYERACRYRRSGRPEARYIAPTNIFVIGEAVVVAQRYYEPVEEREVDDSQLWRVKTARHAFGLSDMHDGNWGITATNEPRVFDLVGWN